MLIAVAQCFGVRRQRQSGKQGQPERESRALNMVLQMDEEGFGGCTNYGECSRVCPQEISIDVIGMLNREYRKATLKKTPKHPPKMVAQ